MNATLVAVTGGLSLLLTVMHVVGGGRECAAPMLRADFDPVAKRVMHVCWHFVTVYLLGTGALLLWIATTPVAAHRSLVMAIAASYGACAVLFIIAAAHSRMPGAWHRFGQWIPFGVMTALGLVAAAA